MDNGKSLAFEIAKILNNVPDLLIKIWVKSRKPMYRPNGEVLISLGNDAHLHLYSQEFDNPVFSIDTHDKYKGPVYIDKYDVSHPRFDSARPSDFEKRVDVWINPTCSYFDLKYGKLMGSVFNGHVRDKRYLKGVDDIVRYTDAVKMFKPEYLKWAVNVNKTIWSTQREE